MHPIHAQLRAHTAAAHAALDARFADGLHGPGRYPAYLLGMHRTVAAFESACVPAGVRGADEVPARAQLLAADLAALGLDTLEPASVAFASEAEWQGGRYVIEGSALGAGMLLIQLRDALPTAPMQFLQGHARPGARWRTLLETLATRPGTDAPALCAGAARMFAVAEDSFARADRRCR